MANDNTTKHQCNTYQDRMYRSGISDLSYVPLKFNLVGEGGHLGKEPASLNIKTPTEITC